MPGGPFNGFVLIVEFDFSLKATFFCAHWAKLEPNTGFTVTIENNVARQIFIIKGHCVQRMFYCTDDLFPVYTVMV